MVLLAFSSSLIPNANPADFTVTFPTGIPLKANYNSPEIWEISLEKFNCWYSWYNISAALGNNTLRYYNGTTWRNVTIPDGSYELKEIQYYLDSVMFANGDYNNANPEDPQYYLILQPNFSIFRLEVILSNGYQLDLTAGNLYILLGFTASIITTTSVGPDQPDITNGITSLQIHCNIVSGSWLNFRPSDILYTFVPTTIPGSLIKISPYQRFYLPLIDCLQITEMRMYITDQNGNLMNFNGQPVDYTLLLQKRSPMNQ